MKNIAEFINKFVNEGFNNNDQFGDYSMNGAFIDYFGNVISKGDTIVFRATDFKDSNDFYRAKVQDLITDKGGNDYVVLMDVESPFHNGKITNGKKKSCSSCVIINNK